MSIKFNGSDFASGVYLYELELISCGNKFRDQKNGNNKMKQSTSDLN